MDSGRYENMSTSELGFRSEHIYQLLAMTHALSKSTKVPSRACSRCNEEFDFCLKVYPNGNAYPKPFCSVLGQTLCGSCSIHLNRQQVVNDTNRILHKFNEPVTESNMKEKALFNRLNYKIKDHLYQNERRGYGDDTPNHSLLIPGFIARNNTPNVRCLQTQQRNREGNKDIFCSQTFKQTLKHVSLVMEDSSNFKDYHLSNKTSHPKLYNLRVQNIGFHSANTYNLRSPYTNKSQNLDMEWPTQPRLNTTELTQKITDVFEQRHLPPVNRSTLTSSTVSSVMDLDLSSSTSSEYGNLKPLLQTYNNVRGRNEDMSYVSNALCPPLMNVKVQLSRQKMFSNKKALFP